MDFNKIKEGVIDLSTFLVGYTIWLGLTAFSFWVAFGVNFEKAMLKLTDVLISAIQHHVVADLLESYELKPLLPIFVLFLIVFILYIHREFLVWTGKFIPPELILDSMPGLRDILPERWSYIMSRVDPNYSFDDIIVVLRSRYSGAIAKYNLANYSEAFCIFKSLALLNFVLFVVGLINNAHFLLSSCLFILFVIASIITVLLWIYHSRNFSYWAINDILEDLVAENAKQKNIDIEEPSSLSNKELSAMREFWSTEGQKPICGLGWSLPLIGNLQILKESLSRASKRSLTLGAKRRRRKRL